MIEWEQDADEVAAASQGALDERGDREIRHWDVVDEASDESFPASDPPAWGSSHAAPTQASAREGLYAPQAVKATGWLRSHIKKLVVGGAALVAAVLGIQRLRRPAAS